MNRFDYTRSCVLDLARTPEERRGGHKYKPGNADQRSPSRVPHIFPHRKCGQCTRAALLHWDHDKHTKG